MAGPADRYEPLPGLFGLPGHFLRKLSRRGRKVAAVVGALLLCGAVAATIVLAPRISESKREYAAAEREAKARSAARARARLIAEQRPSLGRLTPGGGAAAVIPPIERAITRDAQARAAAGELDNRARRTDCRSLGKEGGRLILGCTAVTSTVQTTDEVSGVVVGYSFRAAVSTRTGRYAFCKTSGRPAVGFTEQTRKAVMLSRACGG